MNTIVENITRMNTLSDQVIATDLLLAAKNGIKSLSVAVTETASPDVRQVLVKQLNDSIGFHAAVTDYMMNKGYYHPYNVSEQLQVDFTNAQTAQNLVR